MLLDAVSGPDGKDSTALPQQDPVCPEHLVLSVVVVALASFSSEPFLVILCRWVPGVYVSFYVCLQVSPHVLEQDWTSTPLQGIRVGLPAEFALDELAPHVIEAWDQCAQWLADAGT